jgi:carboxymethylenebutenolidase
MPDVTFPTAAGETPGYLAEPASGRGPGTIVLQEWWGLEEHIRSVCDRFAADGLFALAPDLYRGDSTTKPSEAQQKMMAMSMQQAEQDMCGAADFLAAREGVEGNGVGSVGFCLGGGLSVWALATCPKITAAVSYYYVLPHKPDFSQLKGPVLGHFGTADEFVSVDAAKELESELRQAGDGIEFHFYEGATHAYFNDVERPERVGVYDPDAAQLSWQRTTSFLRRALGASG